MFQTFNSNINVYISYGHNSMNADFYLDVSSFSNFFYLTPNQSHHRIHQKGKRKTRSPLDSEMDSMGF